MSYAEGLHSSDYCYMEGHVYPDATSPDPMARAHDGEPRSKCVRCGEINYGLRAWIGKQNRRRKIIERYLEHRKARALREPQKEDRE